VFRQLVGVKAWRPCRALISQLADVPGLPPTASSNRRRPIRTFCLPDGVCGSPDDLDYGLLVIAAQDDVGGLYVRPPVEGEKRNRNWLTMAYFHEPNFQACVRPLSDPSGDECIHYGTHFTNMFTRCYPDRITTRRIYDEDRLSLLARLREEANAGQE
jgi:isopenicillin N synthase-like dioxygenase